MKLWLFLLCALLIATSPASAASVLWADFQGQTIQRLDAGGGPPQVVVAGGATSPQRPWSVAVDPVNGHLYWTEFGPLAAPQGVIVSADVDGSAVVDVLTTTVSPAALALDPVNGKLYWADSAAQGPIRRANLDGSGVEVVIASASAKDITLDVDGSKIYWTNWVDGSVRRANLDGTNPQLLAGPDAAALPHGIALDLVNRRMYWTEHGNNVIRRARLDGTGAVNLLSVAFPVAIAVDVVANRLYWSQQETGSLADIRSSQLDGSGIQLLASNLGAVFDLTVASEVPPQTIIDSGPPPHTTQTAAVFTFHSTEPSSTFECQLDGGQFTSCSSPASYTVGAGAHTFAVRAVDGDGSIDPSPATLAWTVDASPPETSITSGPSGTIAVGTAAFTWTGIDDLTPAASLTYAFRLHPVETAFSPFGSATSHTYSGLVNGAYTLHVKARDAAGNEDATAATRSFTVNQPPGIRVVSPNGGEVWPVGSAQTIAWAYSGSVGTLVRITLFKGGAFHSTMAPSTSIGSGGAGSFTWLVPAAQTPGADYRVKVVSLANASFQDSSNANFTIQGPPTEISVLSPNGGETWGAGSVQTIRWSFAGNPGPSVAITLLKGGVFNRTIASAAPIGSAGNGSFTWTVPAGQASGANYQIRLVTSLGQQDTSNGFFTIVGSGITVVSPDGGELAPAGSRQVIRWSYTGNPGASVRLSLFKNGVFNRTITSSTAIGTGGTGSFEWTVPASQTRGNDYRVKIISNANPTYQDTSDGTFTIGAP